MGSPLGFPVSNWVAGAVTVTELSDPTGIVATQQSVDTGTVHILSAPEANGDYSFGYWEKWQPLS